MDKPDDLRLYYLLMHDEGECVMEPRCWMQLDDKWRERSKQIWMHPDDFNEMMNSQCHP